jgi:ribosomal protein S14
MRYLYIKNKRLNNNYLRNEVTNIVHKNLTYNIKLPHYIRQNNLACFLNSKFVKHNVRNRCYITNKARSVNNYFKLSRIKLRSLISNSYINAIKKSS